MAPRSTSDASARTTESYLERLFDLEYGDLPEDTVAATRRLIADLVGVSVAGQRSPTLDRVLDLAREHYGGGSASVFGDHERVSPIGAALANGTAGHGWDFDDTFDASPLHTSSSVVPATLALAQETGASGAAVVRAAALGMETHVRLAVACDNSPMQMGWHRTATDGTFGAAVAGAAVLDLDPVEAQHAVSIAFSQAAGHLQVTEGGATKRFQPGHAAAAGVKSALLAADGFPAPEDPWFGPHGFFEVYEDDEYDVETVFDGLGEDFYVDRLSLKPYPCCRYVHSTIDAGLALRSDHGLTLDDVERATVWLNEDAHAAVCEPPEARYSPSTFIHLQFNAPYALAVALSRGRPTLSDFTTDALEAAGELPLETIETRSTTEFDDGFENKISPTRVEVTTTDGRTIELTKTHARGHPENRMSEAEFRTKFSECIAFGPPDLGTAATEDLLTHLLSIDDLDDVAPIFDCLDGDASGAPPRR